MRRTLAVMVGLLPMTLLPCSAWAWGEEGHQLVAAIADQHLTPEAAAKVQQLLGAKHLADADVAAWADMIRADRPETRNWHFAAIPHSAATYDAARDCHDGACAVVKIEELRRKVADPSLDGPSRLEALKFLVHFVGDLHQPLHCTNNDDRGGNEVAVRYPGKLAKTNLHATWDELVLEDAVAASTDSDLAAYVLALDSTIKPAQVSEWTASVNASDWANEAHKMAQGIYAELPPRKGPLATRLKSDYGPKHRAAVELQLKRAGIRLAMLLNLAFDPSSGASARPVAMPSPAQRRPITLQAPRD